MDEGPVYQIKVTLMDTVPPIWRRIQVPDNMKLRKLHKVLQIVMGWGNGHLYQFRAGKIYFGRPDPEGLTETINDQAVTIAQVMQHEKDAIVYEYDMGDGWEHELFLEKVLMPDPKVRLPVCLDGARACPPEDCGGTGGYENLLAALKDPHHPEHKEMKEWLEGCGYENFDSEAFDFAVVNKELRAIR